MDDSMIEEDNEIIPIINHNNNNNDDIEDDNNRTNNKSMQGIIVRIVFSCYKRTIEEYQESIQNHWQDYYQIPILNNFVSQMLSGLTSGNESEESKIEQNAVNEKMANIKD
ncbi:hypothetical protein Glove_256g168 [Diversispora epigaea]|uniref:Uncharacterized protein n=1 Tax=Diversispora epigaea TaxID=1348612 RepID=A0A397IDY4_9GLOM|nr:hypothetical protein Glove_256g168 [Diversispora epigaea]